MSTVSQLKKGNIPVRSGRLVGFKMLSLSCTFRFQAIAKLKSGIKSGRLAQGNFQASRYNPFEGHVFLQDKQVFVHGRSSVNRACQDDVVAIEMLPESEWRSVNSGQVVQEEEGEEDDEEQSITDKGAYHRSNNLRTV